MAVVCSCGASARRAWLSPIGARHVLIKAHCPWQNGKVERFNRTLQTEWAYHQVFTTNARRTEALAPWLENYNTCRRHTALGGLSPVSRLSPTLWPGTARKLIPRRGR